MQDREAAGQVQYLGPPTDDRWVPRQAVTEDTLFILLPWAVHLSREHFAIHRSEAESGEAVFRVRDLGSRSGFLLNGLRGSAGNERPLKDGDCIDCGVRFIFHLG
jgi:hypothetical protein